MALFVHLLSLVMGFGAVILIDILGALWIFKKVELSFVSRVATITQPIIWAGWLGLVASGIVLVTQKGYVDNLTIIKLFLVTAVGINGFFLDHIKYALKEVRDNELPSPLLRFRIALASIISQIGWWGAISIGFLHRHIEHYIPWPENPYAIIISFILLIPMIFLIGESLFGRRKIAKSLAL